MASIIDYINNNLTAQEIASKIEEKLEIEKAKLDTETRRKCRTFWVSVLILSLILEYFVLYDVWH